MKKQPFNPPNLEKVSEKNFEQLITFLDGIPRWETKIIEPLLTLKNSSAPALIAGRERIEQVAKLLRMRINRNAHTTEDGRSKTANDVLGMFNIAVELFKKAEEITAEIVDNYQFDEQLPPGNI